VKKHNLTDDEILELAEEIKTKRMVELAQKELSKIDPNISVVPYTNKKKIIKKNLKRN
jgi:hypothetical protein